MATNTSIPPLRNTVHHFVVTTSSTGITVTMDGTQVLSYATALPPYVLVGFTGATGGFNDIHQVQNVVDHGHQLGAAAPTVTGVSPNSGRRAGGTSVTDHRHGFTGASAVDFGAGPRPRSPSPTRPPSSPPRPAGTGTVDVTVTTPAGAPAPRPTPTSTPTSTPPTVTAVSPTSGPATGGNTVTITGTDFVDVIGIDFGGENPAPPFTVINPTTIVATAPSGALGTIDVSVLNIVGGSGSTPADQYTYTSPPVPAVTGVSPASGPITGGTTVTITGTGLSRRNECRFRPREHGADVYGQQSHHYYGRRSLRRPWHCRRDCHHRRRHQQHEHGRPIHLHCAARTRRHLCQPGERSQRQLRHDQRQWLSRCYCCRFRGGQPGHDPYGNQRHDHLCHRPAKQRDGRRDRHYARGHQRNERGRPVHLYRAAGAHRHGGEPGFRLQRLLRGPDRHGLHEHQCRRLWCHSSDFHRE